MRKNTHRATAVGLFLAALVLSCASTGVPIQDYPNPGKALLIMDMQRDFLTPGARMPIAGDQVEPLIRHVNEAIDRAQKEGWLVIYVQNAFDPGDPLNLFRNQAAVLGTPGSQLDSRIRIVPGPVLGKSEADAFSNPELDRILVAGEVGDLWVVGVFADQCCFTTSQAALNRGYRVNFLVEAVGAAHQAAIRHAAQDLASRGATIVGSLP